MRILTTIKNLRNHKGMVVLSILFGTLYFLISGGNHYNFRTSALDLGVFNQALWQITQGHFPIFSLSVEGLSEVNFFADHFSPGIYLLAPFYYLFGNFTCLVLQVGFILIGGIYAYRLALFSGLNKTTSFLAALLFFCTWGIYGALSFDFHMNVVGAMLVMPLVYYHLNRNKTAFVLLCVAILLSKENMALWLCAILAGLLWMDKAEGRKSNTWLLGSISVFSLIYFFVVIAYVMPALHPDEANTQLNRFVDGDLTLGGKIRDLLFHPVDTISLIWTKHNGEVSKDKMLLHYMMMVSGGIIWFWRPWYFVMMVPIYAQKFLSFDSALWGINNQYSIEYVPVICIGVISATRDVNGKGKTWLVAVFALLAAYFSHTELVRNLPITRFYKGEFFDSGLTDSEIKQAVRLANAEKLCVMSNLAPHAAGHGIMYHFPRVFDSTQILVLKCCRSVYPLTDEDFRKTIDELRVSEEWKIVYEGNEVILFEKQ